MGFLSSLSIRVKVPAAITLLLALILTAFALVERDRLREVTLDAAGDRIQTVAGLLATLLAQSAAEETEELSEAAAEAGFGGGNQGIPESAPGVLEETILGDDGILTLEVWTTDGRCALGFRRPFPPAEGSEVEVGCGDVFPPPELRRPEGGNATRPFRILDNRLYSEWIVLLPTPPGGDPLYLVERRGASDREGVNLVSRLIAHDARLFLGNREGSLWSDFIEPVERPEVPGLLEGPREYEGPDGSAALGVAREVPGTPWVVWLERDRSVVLAPVRAMVSRIVGTGVVVLFFGALLGWAASRRLTRPLRELTVAAEAVAAGHYDRVVPVQGEDELGRLAQAFNVMAGRVSDTRRSLEERVTERTRELEETLERLEEAQEALVRKEKLALLGQLAGGVSHELRNPLGIMSNAVYYLRHVLGEQPPKVDEYLDVLSDQVKASEKIVGDLLDFARTREPEREAVHVPKLIRGELDSLRIPPGVELRAELDEASSGPWAYADQQQVRQILFNLLVNAVQAMRDEGGMLRVCCRSEEGGMVVVEVEDTGAGIPHEEAEAIFQPLYTTKIKGIGLGLTVSRFLAESGGGSLSVESEPGEGSTFTLRLPAHREEGVS